MIFFHLVFSKIFFRDSNHKPRYRQKRDKLARENEPLRSVYFEALYLIFQNPLRKLKDSKKWSGYAYLREKRHIFGRPDLPSSQIGLIFGM